MASSSGILSSVVCHHKVCYLKVWHPEQSSVLVWRPLQGGVTLSASATATAPPKLPPVIIIIIISMIPILIVVSMCRINPNGQNSKLCVGILVGYEGEQ